MMPRALKSDEVVVLQELAQVSELFLAYCAAHAEFAEKE
jgi:hypothetical protein